MDVPANDTEPQLNTPVWIVLYSVLWAMVAHINWVCYGRRRLDKNVDYAQVETRDTKPKGTPSSVDMTLDIHSQPKARVQPYTHMSNNLNDDNDHVPLDTATADGTVSEDDSGDPDQRTCDFYESQKYFRISMMTRLIADGICFGLFVFVQVYWWGSPSLVEQRRLILWAALWACGDVALFGAPQFIEAYIIHNRRDTTNRQAAWTCWMVLVVCRTVVVVWFMDTALLQWQHPDWFVAMVLAMVAECTWTFSYILLVRYLRTGGSCVKTTWCLVEASWRLLECVAMGLFLAGWMEMTSQG
jgi:hypothetical protein